MPWQQALKKIKWRSWLLQLLLLIVIFYGINGYQQRHIIHGPAPEISGTLLNGQAISLAQYRGRPLVLHFWATWCPVCKMENSNIDNLAKDYPVLTIAAWSGSPRDIIEFMETENLSMDTLADDAGNWADVYGVKAVPASFIIDGQGRIRFILTGYTTEVSLRLRLWWLEMQ